MEKLMMYNLFTALVYSLAGFLLIPQKEVFFMSQMEVVYRDPRELAPHPRNGEFFSDIAPDDWPDFIESIRNRGIMNPLLITSQDVVVSGHQRLRAALELALGVVPCIVLENSDNENAPRVLLALIETNIRQRGGCGGTSAKQQLAMASTIAECIDRIRWETWMEWKINRCEPKDEPALTKVYAENKASPLPIGRIRSDLRIFADEVKALAEEQKRREEERRRMVEEDKIDNNFTESVCTDIVKSLTVSEIELVKLTANKMGVSPSWVEKLRSLSNLCPELLDRVDEGQISADAAARLLTKLSPADQETFLAHLPGDLTQKITRKQTEAIITQMREESKAMVDAANSKAEQSEQARRQTETTLASERIRLSALQNEIASLKDELAHSQANTTSAISPTLNKELQALQGKLEAKSLECEKAQQKVRALQHALEAGSEPTVSPHAAMDNEADLFMKYAEQMEGLASTFASRKVLTKSIKAAVERALPLVASLQNLIHVYTD